MNKYVFAQNEIMPLLKRIETGMCEIRDASYGLFTKKSIESAVSSAKSSLEFGDVDAAIGYLEQICSICEKGDLRYGNIYRRIKIFIDEYDNYEKTTEKQRKYEVNVKMIECILKIEKWRPRFALAITLLSVAAIAICALKGYQIGVIISAVGTCVGVVIQFFDKKDLPNLIRGLVDVANMTSKNNKQ